jgi:molybdate transport system substrate-binding protein
MRIAVVVLIALGLSACSSGGSSSTPTLTVSAASSLTGAFTEMGKAFESTHPDASIAFNFGGSSELAEQIAQGANVDVFASADMAIMQEVVDAQLAADPVNFATNIMQIATPAGNPANVGSISDLAKSSIKVAICAAQVPCGVDAVALFANASITVTPVTREPDVKSVLAKVIADEVDAGVVYVTDVLVSGDKVTGVKIPTDVNVTSTYPIAALAESTNPFAAQFAAFVAGPEGQAILAKYGFGKA